MKKYLVLVFSIFSLFSFSQNAALNDALLLEGKAKVFLSKQKDTLTAEDTYLQAVAHLFLNNVKQASVLLDAPIQAQKNKLVFVENYKYLYSYDYDYCLALYYKLIGNGEVSNKYFNLFKARLSDPNSIAIVEFYIHQNENSNIYHDDHSNYLKTVTPYINSAGEDHSPVYIQDHLFYASNYSHSEGVMDPYDVAYSSDFKNNPKLIFPALRKKEHSIQTDFVDGSILLYIQENQKKGNFYISQRNELGYQKPKKLKGAINSKYLDLSASFSTKDSIMYFSSNRPGGFGGMDLYESKLLSDGSWTTPKNLGDKINTSYNEDAPFFDDENDILYFSSNGEASIGGYDFFKAERNMDTLGTAYNLGKPFNSSFDDIFITKNENDFYLSSNRIASQGMDIFNINLTHIDNMLYRWHVTRFPSSLPTTIEQTNCFEFKVESPHQNEGKKVYEWIFNDTDVRKGRTVNYCFEDKTKSDVKLKSITGKYDFVNIEKEYTVDLTDLQLNIIQEGNVYRLKSTNKNLTIIEAYWRFGTETFSNLEIESTKKLDFAIFTIELNGDTHIIKATK